ncbi:MAG: aspartate--tRNA(Asn) ligase [Thermoplasmata archaeon]|nr:aspartate--tRNA(Asn) ligase [Thermoplasmata archaeon]
MEPIGEWRRTCGAGEVTPELDGQEVILGGWVHEVRNLGNLCFIILRDRTGMAQLTLLKKRNEEMFNRLSELSRESVIMIIGVVKASDKSNLGVEVLPEAAKVLAEAKTPLPLGVADKVGADLDTRLDNRYLDIRKPEVMAVFNIRSTILEAVREVLLSHEFLEINTPKIVATATEGGTALFPMEYFEAPAYLNQSPQLYKQILMASGLDRVMELGPAFRAEEHDTSRHLNEFTSIDIEMAFSDEEDAMYMLELVVDGAIRKVLEKNSRDLALLGVELPSQSLPYPRVTYTECVEKVKEAGLDIEWGDDLSMEATRIVAEEQPPFYFITRWPSKSKPFYALPYEDEPKVCRAFDLNHREKEVTSGAQRVHIPDLLRERIAAQGLDIESFQFYLDAFDYGMPPHAGWGLGTERLVMIVTQKENVRECVLFPRDRKRLVP